MNLNERIEAYKALNGHDEPAVPAMSGPLTPVDVRAPRMQKWVAAKFDGQLADVATATEGTRNDTTNRAAYTLGRLVPRYLDSRDVEDALLSAAMTAGLSEREARQAIASGLAAGMREPREVDLGDDRPSMEQLGGVEATTPTMTTTTTSVDAEPVEPITLDTAHEVFARWLGPSYDLQALDAVLAAAAVEQLDGDPAWLLVVSGSGMAKTETVTPLAGAGALVTSTIKGEAALLSATGAKERAKDATGGLLRKIGGRGLLVIKDFTTILSMSRDARAEVLAALREIHDGAWTRNVGAEGGRSIHWSGRIVVIGAVTTAYDQAHAVIDSMGARFVLVRVDSTQGRIDAGRQALANVGHETEMRAELAAAAGAVLAGVDPTKAVLCDAACAELLHVADVVTTARTAVEHDYRAQPIDAHQPEAPTRFAKMLGQLVRGSLSLGASPAYALDVALRVASDSVPPLRLLLLADVLAHPDSRTSDVTRRVQRPRATVDRVLQELHLLGLLTVDDLGDGGGWRYTVASRVDVHALTVLVTRNGSTDP